MKPRDIRLDRPGMPLTGVFGRGEREAAAAYLLMAMQLENSWQPVHAKLVGDAIVPHKKQYHWLSNPFFTPDFDDLIMKGYCFNEVNDFGGGEIIWRGCSDEAYDLLRSSPYAPEYEQAATLLRADQS